MSVSPHVVCYNLSCLLQVGFLYLRYAADPKTLWTWFEPYIEDDEVLLDFQLLVLIYRMNIFYSIFFSS